MEISHPPYNETNFCIENFKNFFSSTDLIGVFFIPLRFQSNIIFNDFVMGKFLLLYSC